MQMCGTAFISQLAVELSLQAEKAKSKMIGDDLVFQSLDALGFKELTESVKQVGFNECCSCLASGRSCRRK